MSATAVQRLLAKVDKAGPIPSHAIDLGRCWVWTGAKNANGYGAFGLEGRTIGAHRAAHILFIGSIPAGLDLDHLCRNRGCVNPTHLEAVTRAENLLRSPFTVTHQRAMQTHCKHGHEFTQANTYRRKDTGTRMCRACHRIRSSKSGGTGDTSRSLHHTTG